MVSMFRLAPLMAFGGVAMVVVAVILLFGVQILGGFVATPLGNAGGGVGVNASDVLPFGRMFALGFGMSLSVLPGIYLFMHFAGGSTAGRRR